MQGLRLRSVSPGPAVSDWACCDPSTSARFALPRRPAALPDLTAPRLARMLVTASPPFGLRSTPTPLRLLGSRQAPSCIRPVRALEATCLMETSCQLRSLCVYVRRRGHTTPASAPGASPRCGTGQQQAAPIPDECNQPTTLAVRCTCACRDTQPPAPALDIAHRSSTRG